MTVAYLVIFVSALPLPAPKRASVAAPPKAWPMPASFLGNCTRTSSIKNRQSKIRNTVKIPIIHIIYVTLSNRVFDYISKTPIFKRSATYQSPVNVRQAHQFAGITRLDAATILDANVPRNRFIEHFDQ